MTRSVYQRRNYSSVWHFMETCRYWPGKMTLTYLIVHSLSRPKHGTLCDYCQRLEKKKGS